MGFSISALAAWTTAEFITVTGITDLAVAQAVFAATIVAAAVDLVEPGLSLAPSEATS
jgi:hypothetical protein